MDSNFKKVQIFNNCGGNYFGSQKHDIKGNAVENQKCLIDEELEELWSASTITEIRDAIADVLVTTYGLAHILGIDADVDMEIVNQSNMSKFCKDIEEAEASCKVYKQFGIDTVIEQVKGDPDTPAGGERLFVIKSQRDQKDSDFKSYPKGKILKGVSYEPPKFD